MALREDFKDSILNMQMNGAKQYRMVSNANGTYSFEDVTNYDQEGSMFGAKEVNDITKVVNEARREARSSRPLFVKSLAECTDTSRLYVLPDGYIYEYRYVEPNITNHLSKAVDASGKPYNGGVGYKKDIRLDSSGQEVAAKGMFASGFIPVKKTDKLRTRGINYSNDSGSRIIAYRSDKTYITCWQGGGTSSNNLWDYITEIDSTHKDININLATAANSIDFSQIAYVRISGTWMSADSMVTLNQDPYEQGKMQWVNTGTSYGAPDYEERIIAIESQLATFGGAPAYVVAEAERVANIVQERRTEKSLVFGAVSDFHAYAGSTTALHAKTLAGIEHAGMGLKEIQKNAALDMVALFGDYTWGDTACTAAQAKKDFGFVKNKLRDAMVGVPSIWMTGNHDINYQAGSERRLTADEMYAYIGSNNVGTVKDPANLNRNYGYIDFESQRIRVIYLNTTDSLDYPDNTGTADNAAHITATQLQWVINNAMDFADKDSPADWGIVLMSHQPLDGYGRDVLKVLEAYKNGINGSLTVDTNGKVETVNYSFSGKTRASIIASFHGHMHNFKSVKISSGSSVAPWLWRIGIPNACSSRDNEVATNSDASWAQKYGEFDGNNPVYYRKVSNSEKDTSFNVIVIDRKNRKIYATCYGAGYDRTFNY